MGQNQSGSNSVLHSHSFVQLSHRSGIEQSVRPSRSHNQRLVLNLRISFPGEKSRSTWCFRWVPAIFLVHHYLYLYYHLTFATERKEERKKLCYLWDCILCTNLNNVP